MASLTPTIASTTHPPQCSPKAAASLHRPILLVSGATISPGAQRGPPGGSPTLPTLWPERPGIQAAQYVVPSSCIPGVKSQIQVPAQKAHQGGGPADSPRIAPTPAPLPAPLAFQALTCHGPCSLDHRALAQAGPSAGIPPFPRHLAGFPSTFQLYFIPGETLGHTPFPRPLWDLQTLQTQGGI